MISRIICDKDTNLLNAELREFHIEELAKFDKYGKGSLTRESMGRFLLPTHIVEVQYYCILNLILIYTISYEVHLPLP